MKTKIFTLLFTAFFVITNAQNNPIPVNDFTPSYTRLVPTDSWDGNSSAWYLFQYYDWSSQSAGFTDANVDVGEGLITKILLPPGIEKISIQHNDEYLAGSQCVRYRIIGEYDITDNGPSLITADNDSDWYYGCGGFGLSGQYYYRTSDISTEKYVLIAYFNDGNDLDHLLNFQDYNVNWVKGTTPADTLLFYNWVHGINNCTETITPGEISGSQEICDGEDPEPFTSVVDATGNADLSYQWQYSEDQVNWIDAEGETNPAWDLPATTFGYTTQTTLYGRRKATDCSGTVYSNIITLTIDVCNTINESDKRTSFNIYPNPATNYVQLSFSDEQFSETVKILDITGKKLKQFKIQNSKFRINISDLQNGVYFVKIGTQVQKFIKK